MVLFDDLIADMFSNKKSHEIVTKFFVSCKNLNISIAFVSQSCFAVIEILLSWNILDTILLWKFKANSSSINGNEISIW